MVAGRDEDGIEARRQGVGRQSILVDLDGGDVSAVLVQSGGDTGIARVLANRTQATLGQQLDGQP